MGVPRLDSAAAIDCRESNWKFEDPTLEFGNRLPLQPLAYHYTECGLDDVWLENGYTLHRTAYGEGLSIRDSAGLHRAIGGWLIARPKPIDGAGLRFIRLEMELTQHELATLLGATEQALRRWEKARRQAVQGPADRLLRAIYAECLGKAGSVRALVDRQARAADGPAPDGSFRETADGWQAGDVVQAA